MACADGNCPAESNPDPAACACPPCPNARLCRHYHNPPVYLEIHRGTCMFCDMQFGRALTFVAESSECAVCLETKPEQVVHPSGCGHRFCVECIRELFWPAGGESVSAEEFGWRGDDEDDEVFEQWLETTEGRAYNTAYDRAETDAQDRYQTKCPLCRRERVWGLENARGGMATVAPDP